MTPRPLTLVLVLLAAGCGAVTETETKTERVEPELPSTRPVTVRIDFGGEPETRTLELPHVSGTSLFDLMRFAKEDGDLEFESETAGDLPFVTAIEGVANEGLGGRNWQYWVDGEYATVGAGSFVPKPGTTVEWRYTKRASEEDEE